MNATADQKSAFEARVARVCAVLPGAELNDPTDGRHDAWRVGDKMFAYVGMAGDGVSVKCADIETSEMLIEAGVGVKAPYFHKSWVRLPSTCDDAELSHRLVASYDLIRAKLPVAVRKALPSRKTP